MSHLLETLEKAIKQEACKKGLFEKGFSALANVHLLTLKATLLQSLF